MKIVMACTEVVTGAQIQNREDNASEDEFLGPKDGKDGNPFLAKKILRLDWGTDQLQVACTRHVWCDRDAVVLTT